MRWQKRARLLIGVFAVVFAVAVAFAFKKRTPAAPAAAVVQTDPGTVVQSTGGRIDRFSFAREAVSIQYDKQLTYSDNTTKMLGVRVVTAERGGDGRTFTITGREGKVGQNESTIALDGDVQIVASDGLTLKTEHATYADADGIVRAPGPVSFAKGRMAGGGTGLTYDKVRDVLTILDQAAVRIAADEHGNGAADIHAGAATMARHEKTIRFERGLHVQRPKQTIDANAGTAYLSPDEKRIETVDLQGSARIGGIDAAPGSLQALTGESMNLKYTADGQALERASVSGAASIQLAGEAGAPGRQIVANTLDISLAPDGSTPTALVGKQSVKLTMPAAAGVPARSIASDAIDAKGAPGRGLTRARFTGAVDYRETGSDVNRAAKSTALDVALKPGMSEIEDARFSGRVRFEEGTLAASGNAARYDLAKGTLELRGIDRDPPHLINDRISVDAGKMDVTLAGPKVKAAGSVKSVLQPPKPGAAESRVPSMLKQDQPVNVTADALDYDGASSKAIYTGAAVLWQGDTSVKGASITIDDKTGDLSATGPVTTTSMLEQNGKDNKKERVRSIATAADFNYTEAKHLAVYTGGAHLSGPQGDITGGRIDLFLKPSGDEIDRAEGYATDADAVTIREQNRKTTGTHLTYTSADDRYVVTGKPAKNVDACGNETTGATLTFVKATDTILVDGNGFRTQTKGTGVCK